MSPSRLSFLTRRWHTLRKNCAVFSEPVLADNRVELRFEVRGRLPAMSDVAQDERQGCIGLRGASQKIRLEDRIRRGISRLDHEGQEQPMLFGHLRSLQPLAHPIGGPQTADFLLPGGRAFGEISNDLVLVAGRGHGVLRHDRLEDRERGIPAGHFLAVLARIPRVGVEPLDAGGPPIGQTHEPGGNPSRALSQRFQNFRRKCIKSGARARPRRAPLGDADFDSKGKQTAVLPPIGVAVHTDKRIGQRVGLDVGSAHPIPRTLTPMRERK